jgi:ABC-type multidrug transport system fused ATPase/permease subunit
MIRLRTSTIYRCLRILSARDRKKLLGVAVIQIFLAGLDLVGVAIVGILGSLAINGISSKGPGDRVEKLFSTLNLADLSIQEQAAVLGFTATVVLLGKTLISVFLTRKVLFFLSRRSAILTDDLLRRIIVQPLVKIQEYSSQQMLYTVTAGVYTVTVGILGTTVLIITDSALLITLLLGMLVIDPLVALITIMIFACIGLILYSLMHLRMRKLGAKDSALSIESNQKIIELLGSYREIFVRNRQTAYIDGISKIRGELSNTLADMSFMPNISKYVIEMTVVFAAVLVSAVQFYFYDAAHAVATLALFLAASTRIAPAVLRLQQSSLVVKGSLGSASQTLWFFENLAPQPGSAIDLNIFPIVHEGFEGAVSVRNISYKYPNSTAAVISDVSLEIHPGEFVAVVGASGAGKSTLMDLLIGVLNPDSGSISISGTAPKQVVSRWPGAIGYVPQEISIIDGTIAENVLLGFDLTTLNESFVTEALNVASMSEFVKSKASNIHTRVGEAGTRLSGGQRQRLGIARAMVTKPKLIFFDEATSALDGQTESEISQSIQNLKGQVTLVMIAHRLSTIRYADRVIYMDSGKVVAQGSFEEVRKMIPDFEKQAQLMGL